MYGGDLWKYCSRQQEQEFLLSLKLLGDTQITPEKQLACLYSLSRNTEKHYRPQAIPKKNGGLRQLAVPDSRLKLVQRNLLHHVLDGFSVSPYAMAYGRKRGIRENAAAHLGGVQVLNLDISSFFDSITYLQVYQRAFPAAYFPASVRTLLTNLCCYQDRLPQGAPTSGAVSNLVMKPFDEHMGVWCKARGITYTRYCDDMTFSGDLKAWTVKNKVRSYLLAMGFELNEEKSRTAGQGRQQKVTGVVVNQKMQVPSAYRRRLRQEVHYSRSYPEEKSDQYLQALLGKVGFVLSINPQDPYFLAEKEWLRKELKRRGER